MTNSLTSTVSTPIGPFTVITTDSDHPAVLASGWTADVGDLLPVISVLLRPITTTAVPSIPGITDAVIAYHEGDFGAVDDVAVTQKSGPFLSHAWEVLRQVKPGHPVTYTQFAELSGRPTAIRGAASACARNAAALFVPCHRVVGSNGALRGFRWGLPAKKWLLDHEEVTWVEPAQDARAESYRSSTS